MTEPNYVYEPGCLHGLSFYRACAACGRTDERDALRAAAADLQAAAIAADDRLRAAEKLLRSTVWVMRFHNETPTGRTKRCLPDCIACAAIREVDGFLARAAAGGQGR